MNSTLLRVLPLLCGFSALCVAAAPPAQDLFNEAQLQETTARDMDAAIRLYQQFLAAPNADRNLQARAYLHLGLCEAKTGQMEPAKAAWRKIVQDYSDQREPYADALHQLQVAQAAEPPAPVVISTPTVQIVYRTEVPSTKWTIDIPQVTFLHTIDSKGQFSDNGTKLFIAGQYFFLPRLGLGLQLGGVSDYGVYSTAEIGQLLPFVATHTAYWGPFALYGKSGIGAYSFHFHNVQDGDDETKWRPGLYTEAGLVLGWYRGFTFNAGYVLHAVFQATPSNGFVARARDAEFQDPDSDVFQEHGLRFLGGPVIGLSFRW